MAGFGGVLLGGIAQGVEAGQKQDLAKAELGIRNRLADIQQQEVDQKGKANQQALFKDMLDRSATALNDATALWEKLVSAAPDKSAPQLLQAGQIIRGQIEATGTGLSQIPGGMNVAQSALKKFDAITAGLPSAVEAATTAGAAEGAKAVAAQPGTTAADVAKTTALGPVNAHNAALTAQATAPIAVQQAADTAAAVAPIEIDKAGKVAEAQARGSQAGRPTAQSDQGKQVLDRQSFVSQYGENSPQVKAFDDAVNQKNNPSAKLSDVAELRKEYTKLSTDFVTVRDSFAKLSVAANDPSPAGDIAMVFHFMKLLDPTSVVREGEYATAANAAGVPDRIMAQYNKILSGQKLAPAQRADFLHQAENVFRVQLQAQSRLESQFRNTAEKRKIDPSESVVDFIGPYRPLLQGGDTAGGGSGAGGGGALPKLGLDGKLQ